MGVKFKSITKILSMILGLMIMTFNVQLPVCAESSTVYVSGDNGSDSNSGSVASPVKSIEKALELVSEGGTIQIVDSTSSQQPSEDEPLCITKSITVIGGELTLSKAGIVLGADVAFQDISINFANPVRNAVIANGYTLILSNVKGSGTYPIHLFCGEVTGYTGSVSLPTASDAGAITISGTDNDLGDIFAGSLSEYGAENTWNGNSTIIIDSTTVGELGNVYAHGAMEPRGSGNGAGMTPESSSYTIEGKVNINLSGSKPMTIEGSTGGSRNAEVVVSGGNNLISGITLRNLSSLSVTAGTLQPAALNAGLDLSVSSGAELDLSQIIEDESVFSVGNFNGGGMLVVGQKDKLQVNGTITGITEFQTSDNRPNDKSTSGTVEYSYPYIDVTNASGEGSFRFFPYETQLGTTLTMVSTELGATAWTTSDAKESSDLKPDSFDIPETSYMMTKDEIIQSGLIVPVTCDLSEDEFFWDVPLKITVSKDGGEAVLAEESYDGYGYNYTVPDFGFEEIFGTYGQSDNDWDLIFYTETSGIEAGAYSINVSVTLSDNTIVTKVISLTVTELPETLTFGETQIISGGVLQDDGIENESNMYQGTGWKYDIEVNAITIDTDITLDNGAVYAEGDLNIVMADDAVLILNANGLYGIQAAGKLTLSGNGTVILTGRCCSSEFCFSEGIHLKINADAYVLGDSNGSFNISSESAETYYWRDCGDSEFKTQNTEYDSSYSEGSYFEYIGIDHLEYKSNNAVKTHSLVCKCTEETIKTVLATEDCTDSDLDGKCDLCSLYMDGIGAKLAGYTLSLNGNIGVNFYMELADTIISDDGAYMQFTLPDHSLRKVYVTEAVPKKLTGSDKTYYVFSCDVASYEMTGMIKAQMYDGNNNAGIEHSYTVRDYAEYIIDHADSYTVDDVAFAKAMLNYGASSQIYFETETDDLANKNLLEEEQTVEILTSDSLSAYRVTVAENTLGAFAGYSLVLKSETTLRVYFKPAANVQIENLIFKAGGQIVTPVQLGEYYVLSVENIKAWDLDTDYTFEVSDGTTELEFVCCALSYGYSVLNRGNTVYSDNLIQLISALRVYQQRAEVYV